MKQDRKLNQHRKEPDQHHEDLLKEQSPHQEEKSEDFSLQESAFLDQILKENLLEDLSFAIPEDFADRICDRIEKRNLVKEGIEKYLLMSLGYLGIPGIALALLFFTKSELLNPIIPFLMEFKWHLLFALFCITAIQIADLYWVKSRKEIKD